MNRISRFATAVVVSGGLSLAGLGLATGTAQADPAFGPSYGGGNCPPGVGTCTHWCPGDPLIPGSHVITWDWNICHDWYWNSEGVVDIASNIDLPVAWRSASGSASAATTFGAAAAAASAGPLPAVERHHRPFGVRRPLVDGHG